jgi:hypothetical protein
LVLIFGWKSEQPFFPPLQAIYQMKVIHQRCAKKFAMLSAGLTHVDGLFKSLSIVCSYSLFLVFAFLSFIEAHSPDY